MNATSLKGKVILAGAGPGDPELISVKAVKWLQKADIVLADRLVSRDLLNEYVSPKAQVICVGKQGRYSLSTPQKKINQLMIDFSREGKTVVRLKGGDVSVFANLLDELQALLENNIPYEIVPGISAALGAAAYAGIPLTARNFANAVRLLTFYKNDIFSADYWNELASTDDTLVFYMSSGTLDEIVGHLKQNGIAGDKYIAIVEQATTTQQNVHVANIYQHREELGDKEFASPSLLIIGKVVALHEQFAWLRNSNSSEPYFEPADAFRREAV
ncbi:MAG: uroporphyrinogen-III C-methyltransferase [Ferruginibacter sp.]